MKKLMDSTAASNSGPFSDPRIVAAYLSGFQDDGGQPAPAAEDAPSRQAKRKMQREVEKVFRSTGRAR